MGATATNLLPTGQMPRRLHGLLSSVIDCHLKILLLPTSTTHLLHLLLRSPIHLITRMYARIIAPSQSANCQSSGVAETPLYGYEQSLPLACSELSAAGRPLAGPRTPKRTIHSHIRGRSSAYGRSPPTGIRRAWLACRIKDAANDVRRASPLHISVASE